MQQLLFTLFVLLTPLTAAGQDNGIAQENICANSAEGAECWKELQSHAGCYVWDSQLVIEQAVAWTGMCTGNFASGEGILTWSSPEEVSVYETQLSGGKYHGHTVIRYGNGTVVEGTYSAGARAGHWVTQYADGGIMSGLYVNGLRAGLWVYEGPQGQRNTGTYVNGELHGTVVRTAADGTVTETPFVEGEIHGTEVRTERDGTVTRTSYADGEKHGIERVSRSSGGSRETPYENGERHGTEVVRDTDGTVTETPYVNGEIDGIRRVHWADGSMRENPYVNGLAVPYAADGTIVFRDADGYVTETPYVDGEIHGTVVAYLPDGSDYYRTQYMAGAKHGIELVYRATESWGRHDYEYVPYNTNVIYMAKDPETILVVEPFPQTMYEYFINTDNSLRYNNSLLIETPYVNGERHGTQIVTRNGSITEVPYVEGRIHGTVIGYLSDGSKFRESPFVNGVRHGTHVYALGGGLQIFPFSNGKLHGTSISYNVQGLSINTDLVLYSEQSYVNGDLHGTSYIVPKQSTNRVVEWYYEHGVSAVVNQRGARERRIPRDLRRRVQEAAGRVEQGWWIP